MQGKTRGLVLSHDKIDHCKIEGIVPRRFHRWMKVFGKVDSERMPVRKVWDHAIDLREEFVPSIPLVEK